MGIKLDIAKETYLIDETVKVVCSGCQPNSELTLIAEMQDQNSKNYLSESIFMTDNMGVVDISRDKPVGGSYLSFDPSGLFWSMKIKESAKEDYFEASDNADIDVTVKAVVKGEVEAQCRFTFVFSNEKIEEVVIDHEWITGSFYRPIGQNTYPSIILLNGSDGGRKANAAAFLSTKGYNVLALSYFNDEAVSKELENIPLEYFKEAVEWLRDRPGSDGSIHLIGYSKGAELALLLGSYFTGVNSIIAGAPGAYVTSGMKDGVFAPITGWTKNGKEIPYLKNRYPIRMMADYFINLLRKQPVSFLSIWKKTLKNKKQAKPYEINVEQISCPIMLISGGKDQLWPSEEFSKLIENKRNNSKDRYMYFENGGHFLSFPYSFYSLPSNTHMKIGRMTMDFGGDKESNAQAANVSLMAILDFLESNKV